MLKELKINHLINPKIAWLEQQQTSIISAAAVITAANILSALAAIVRQRLLTDLFFDTPASARSLEALMVSFQIPDMMFQLLVIGSISAAFIPVFTGIKRQHGEAVAMKMTSSILTLLLIGFIVVSIFVSIYSRELTTWRTGVNYTPEQIELTTQLTRIILIAQFFFLISSIQAALLQSYQRFIIPSLSPILYNVGIVLGAWLLAPYIGIYGAAVGVCLGAFLHLAIQVPFTRNLGYRFRPSFNWKVPGVTTVLMMMPPRTLTLAIGEIEMLILTYVTTNIGNLSFLVTRYALIIITLPIRLFGVPMGQASLPFLSEQAEDTEKRSFCRLVTQSLNQIAYLAMPSSVLILILRVPIVRIVFGTSNFPWESTLMTSKMIGVMALTITAQAMVHLLVRAFHAHKDTWTPFMVALSDLCIFTVGVIIVQWLAPGELVGLAWVFAVASMVELIWLIGILNHRYKEILTRAFFSAQGKIILSSFLMAVFLYLPFRLFDKYLFNTTRTLELLALTITTGTIGMLVYAYFAHVLQVREQTALLSMISGYKRNRNTLSQTTEVVTQAPESEPL